MMFRLPKFLIFAAMLVGGISVSQPVSADPVTVRGTQGDGFARLTFTWPAPVPFVARIVDRQLVVQFGRPVESNFAGLPGRLSAYIGAPRLSGAGRTVTFPLKNEYDLNFNSRGRLVTVDLIELEPQTPPQASQPAPAPAPKPAPQQAQSSPRQVAQPPPAASRAPNQQSASSAVTARTVAPANLSEKVGVRTGQHPDYGRLVFDWTKKVPYKVDRQGNRASISFGRAADINLSRVQSRRAQNVGGAESVVTGAETVVVLNVPSTSRVRHFLSGSKVVFDVFNPTGRNDANDPPPASFKPPQPPQQQTAAAEPPAQSSSQRAPQATPQAAPAASPAAPSQGPSATPSTPSPADQAGAPPVPSPATPAAPAPVTLNPGDRSVQTGSQEPAVATVSPSEPAASQNTGSVAPQIEADVPSDAAASIRLDWNEPVAAAVFRRAGALWMVFDKARRFDMVRIREQSRGIFFSADQVSAQRGTFLRFTTPEGINPSIRRDGLAWIFDFKEQPLRPQTSLNARSQVNSPIGPRLFMPVAQAGDAIPFHDAAIGDNLIVIPVIPLSHGIANRRTFPQVRVLPTAQGVVIQPKIDDLRARSLTQGIEVSAASRLALSSQTPKATANARIAPLSSIQRIFRPDVWRVARREGLRNFQERRREMMADIAESRGSNKQQARQRLAEYFFGQNFGYEALGVLRLLIDNNPALEADPKFRMLRGGSNFLIGRYEEAAEDLDHESLDGTDEGEFWRAINLAAMGELEEAAPVLKEKGTIIRSYPKQIKMPLGLLITEAAIRAGDIKFATNYLQVISEEEPTPKEVDQLALIEGKLQQLAGDFDAAVEAWEAAAEGEHRPSIAEAIRNRAELLLTTKKIETKEAIEELEGLRFSWRGGEFEFDLLRKLGRYYFDIQDFRNGLRTLRAAASYFRGHDLAPEVTKEMATAFVDLYLNDAADVMQPVQAIALFDEFKELTPSGERGDEMIRKLADRLARVDLLDRAAKLLRQQISFRLKGVERARVGARLATVRLLNSEPALALDAILKSDDPALPPELAIQRLQLQSRALIDLGRQQEAIDILKEDASREADLLRGEVFWKAKAWPEAIDVFERLVESTGAAPGKQLDERQALFVLNLGVVLALAGDDTASARLRGDYGSAMDDTPFKDAFRLIATPNATGLVDFRSVAGKVETVSNFRSFMDSYKQRLKEGKLSQLN